jgi:hypothetical protein
LKWELFDHPPYRSDLALHDYHLFAYLRNWLRSQRFNNSEQVMEGSSQAAESFDTGIQKLISRYDRCFNSDGDYVEK